MNYTDAIEYLREHKIFKDDGSVYEFGEVSCKSLMSSIVRCITGRQNNNIFVVFNF